MPDAMISVWGKWSYSLAMWVISTYCVHSQHFTGLFAVIARFRLTHITSTAMNNNVTLIVFAITQPKPSLSFVSMNDDSSWWPQSAIAINKFPNYIWFPNEIDFDMIERNLMMSFHFENELFQLHYRCWVLGIIQHQFLHNSHRNCGAAIYAVIAITNTDFGHRRHKKRIKKSHRNQFW